MAASDAQALLLQVSADTSKAVKRLDDLNKKLSGVATQAERTSKQASSSLDRFFGKANAGKAFDQVFDRTRFTVLDSGAAKIGLFGSALESLGPAGLAAAAGIAAVGAAFAGARQAASYADELADTAKRLHVTTDALQEYRYAIRAAGGEEKGADEALEAFSATLGKAQEGLKKSVKGFRALGFSTEEINGFKSAEEALGQVVARISGLSNVQQDAIIEQLGLKGLKPLIADGVVEMERLRKQARDLGLVMDAELIKRGAELNDEFETVQKRIDIELKSALIDAAPALLALLKLAAELAEAAGAIADSFRSIEDKRTKALEGNIAAREQRGKLPVIGGVLRAIDRGQLAAEKAELAKRKAEAKPTPPRTPTRSITGAAASSGGGSKPKDTTVARSEQVNAAIASAERDVLQALLGLTEDVEARAALQKKILAAEGAQDTARLNRQIADIQADEGLSAATKKDLVAKLEQVRADEASARAAKAQQIDRELEAQLARQATERRVVALDGEAELLRLQGNLSTSAAEQQAIALRLVEIGYQIEKARLEEILASKSVSEADKQIAALKLKQLEQQQPARVEDARRNGSDPAREANDIVAGIQKQDSLVEDTAAMYAEIDRLRQADVISEAQAAQARAEVNARYNEQRLANAQSFFSNLATLSQSSNKTLAAIGKAAAIAQATIDGVLAVQKALASAPPPLNFVLAAAAGAAAAVNVAKIASMADGGEIRGPGGSREDKVPIYASPGEHLVNARAARQYRPQLDAMNAGRIPRFADGGIVGPGLPASLAAPRVGRSPTPGPVVQQHFHLEGSVLTQDLVDQMNETSRRQAAAAGASARRAAAADAAASQYSRDLNS